MAKFISKFNATGLLARKPGSGRPTKITERVEEIVETWMREDDETTAYQLHGLLAMHGLQISKRTVPHCREHLGWTFRGSAYCQLIRDTNKQKRFEWVHQYLQDSFKNVVWTNECLVRSETHKCFCCRKNMSRLNQNQGL